MIINAKFHKTKQSNMSFFVSEIMRNDVKREPKKKQTLSRELIVVFLELILLSFIPS